LSSTVTLGDLHPFGSRHRVSSEESARFFKCIGFHPIHPLEYERFGVSHFFHSCHTNIIAFLCLLNKSITWFIFFYNFTKNLRPNYA
jgi:hypothetical protein